MRVLGTERKRERERKEGNERGRDSYETILQCVSWELESIAPPAAARTSACSAEPIRGESLKA